MLIVCYQIDWNVNKKSSSLFTGGNKAIFCKKYDQVETKKESKLVVESNWKLLTD